MAQINLNQKKSRSRGAKRLLRIDFTPMVDMNMLLITFFMFCTTLSIPQTMDIVLPTKETSADGTEIPKSKVITFLLDGNNEIYYYAEIPDYNDPSILQQTNYADDGLRQLLLDRNTKLASQAISLRNSKQRKQISESDFKQQMSELKNSKDGIVVLIKPTNRSSYKNLVDFLDEMQICSINKYTIVELTEGDESLLQKYKSKNNLTASL